MALSLLGAGAGVGINHQVSGVASRTFSEPLPRIKQASLMAAKRMSFQFDSTDTTDAGQVMRTRVAEMDLELALEVLSTSMTRVSVSARKNIFMLDSATAQEVVVQIERALLAMELAEAKAQAGVEEKSEIKNTRFDVGSEAARNAKARAKPKNTGAI